MNAANGHDHDFFDEPLAAWVVIIHRRTGTARDGTRAWAFGGELAELGPASAEGDDVPFVIEHADAPNGDGNDQRTLSGNGPNIGHQRGEFVKRVVRESEPAVLRGDESVVFQCDVDRLGLAKRDEVGDVEVRWGGGDDGCWDVRLEGGLDGDSIDVLDFHFLDFPTVFHELFGGENLMAVRLAGVDVVVPREIVVFRGIDLHAIPTFWQGFKTGQAVDSGDDGLDFRRADRIADGDAGTGKPGGLGGEEEQLIDHFDFEVAS